MAESSSRASSSSARRGRGLEGMGSPIPYREGPLAYEPAVMCRCGLKAPKWISWSDDNPGRRYYRCRRSKSAMDCGFYVWIDEEASPFMRILLLDLRDAVWRLKKENGQLKNQALCDVGLKWEKKVQELQELNHMLVKENLDKMEEIKAKEVKLAKINSASACSSFCCLVVVFVVGLAFGLMLGGVMFGKA
ncbi:unnamed protein product [Urochloa humidicola]